MKLTRWKEECYFALGVEIAACREHGWTDLTLSIWHWRWHWSFEDEDDAE